MPQTVKTTIAAIQPRMDTPHRVEWSVILGGLEASNLGVDLVNLGVELGNWCVSDLASMSIICPASRLLKKF